MSVWMSALEERNRISLHQTTELDQNRETTRKLPKTVEAHVRVTRLKKTRHIQIRRKNIKKKIHYFSLVLLIQVF